MYSASLRWEASPAAVAYRLYWRDAGTRDWQHSRLVGNVTQHELPDVLIDDVVMGEAAVGPGGHESLVSAYLVPPFSGINLVGP